MRTHKFQRDFIIDTARRLFKAGDEFSLHIQKDYRGTKYGPFYFSCKEHPNDMGVSIAELQKHITEIVSSSK